MKILIIKNLKQLEIVLSKYRTFLSTHVVITNSPRIYNTLNNQCRQIKCFGEYLQASDYPEIIQEARRMSRDWYNAFEHFLDYKGLNLGE